MIAAGSMPSLDTVLKATADIRLKYQPLTIQVGRYDNRLAVEVDCETQPVCEEHYLHRLRNPAALVAGRALPLQVWKVLAIPALR
jgi:hypothetical protein